MKRKPYAIYQTANELDERILKRTVEAHQYPANSKEQQTVLNRMPRRIEPIDYIQVIGIGGILVSLLVGISVMLSL